MLKRYVGDTPQVAMSALLAAAIFWESVSLCSQKLSFGRDVSQERCAVVLGEVSSTRLHDGEGRAEIHFLGLRRMDRFVVGG